MLVWPFFSHLRLKCTYGTKMKFAVANSASALFKNRQNINEVPLHGWQKKKHGPVSPSLFTSWESTAFRALASHSVLWHYSREGKYGRNKRKVFSGVYCATGKTVGNTRIHWHSTGGFLSYICWSLYFLMLKLNTLDLILGDVSTQLDQYTVSLHH